jgi:hypothetical protein
VNDDRICISEENVYCIFGIRDFTLFWRVRSPIAAYRVYREDVEVYVEFEGERAKIMSYLFVGAVDCHLARLHIIANELEKIVAVLSRAATERPKHSETHVSVVEEEVAEEVEVCKAREEEEEPPRKKTRLTAGICRRSEYDPERMEPYPRCNEKLKSKLSEKGLIMFILKDREEEPDSDTDAYLTPTELQHTYENIRQVP